MSTTRRRLAQLRQAGFVDVDRWSAFGEVYQQQLLAALRNDPQVTELQ